MTSVAAATAITLASTAASTAVGVYSSIQQGKAASAQAKHQADVARQNQELAEQEASAQRKQGYDAMVAQRQKVAKLIGQQRAAAGASGAAVDIGSNLDLQADTAAQGELDAINMYNKGIDAAYNTDIEAWNYGNQASAYDASAKSAERAGYMNAVGTALGGIADMGSTWAGYKAKQPSSNGVSGGVSGSQRVTDNYKGVPRMSNKQFNDMMNSYF
jgi:hypothetical protein